MEFINNRDKDINEDINVDSNEDNNEDLNKNINEDNNVDSNEDNNEDLNKNINQDINKDLNEDIKEDKISLKDNLEKAKKKLIFKKNIINDRVILNEDEIIYTIKNKIINNNCIYITGCTMNCGKHLNNIYSIMLEIGNLFKDYRMIFSFDESKDNTLQKLEEFKEENDKIIILKNSNKMSDLRTENISNARNLIIKKIKEINNFDYKYFIMMDMDEVCNKRFNINVLKKYIINGDDNSWDALSFNRSGYYDVWALSYNPYMFSCWHYFKEHNENRNFMKNTVRPHFEEKLNSLKDDELLDVYSAFGGFSIYKTDKFIDSYYHWKAKDILELIPEDLKFKNVEKCNFLEPYIFNNKSKKIFDCEHRFFHLYAKKNFKTKIKVSPHPLFGD